MRILQIVPGYPPSWAYGGPARVAQELSHALIRRGHEVVVYTTDVFCPVALKGVVEETSDGAVRVIRMRNVSRKMAEKARLFLPISFRKQLHRHLASFDLVHIHEHRAFYNAFVRNYANCLGKPYIITTHGTTTYNGQQQMPKWLFDLLIGKRILQDAAGIVALSVEEVQSIKAIYRKTGTVSVIPNGVHIPTICSPEELEIERRRLGVPADKCMILYLGRIARSKAVDLVIEAVAADNQVRRTAHFVCCGPDDGFRQSLQQLVYRLGLQENVTFVAPVYQDLAKQRLYQASDIVVVPRFTGLPLVLLEAAANGRTAVTTSSCAAIPWLDGRGALVVHSSPEVMGRALADLIRDGDRRQKMGEYARRTVAADFSWDRVATLYEEMYDRARWGVASSDVIKYQGS